MHMLGIIWLAVLQTAFSYLPYERGPLEQFHNALPPKSLLDKDTGMLLKPLLRPRVSGTEGASEALEFLKSFLTHNLTNWKVEEDRFVDKTPLGDVEFVNLIATLDPPGSTPENVGHLVLAAHYDSKRLPAGFIGAIDSAAPCAMLLYIAQMLSENAPNFWESHTYDGSKVVSDWERTAGRDAHQKGVQLIFFDGEEAVHDWTDTDSIYGARHLAKEWETEHLRPQPTSSRHTKLQTIDLFVLLDLLGAKDTTIPSYFPTTHWAIKHLARIEHELRSSQSQSQFPGAFAKQSADPIFDARRQMFGAAGTIGDDHMPFWKKGVEILHIIPVPFPHVWHTMEDNGDNLDQDSVRDLATIFSIFTAEWMEFSRDRNFYPAPER
ncbi:hypothetical protein BCR37DRAFT_390986 [Protomyces lactucae-debilis]|uniref:Peptide hydrolase n=1 Tax=Protomyces lactucae-debilis TaxID=2754530 RepID=A0A1Y2FSM0_PROLT|nr:uncharacterized protein BCR37DRAFT_390986 [Protomyces lactucae-debilis]ORY86186.1 hypothetical protein BCR37DRAFT_390986 [Protomyces lactucae-debilis]